jgi:hypothetical protein
MRIVAILALLFSANPQLPQQQQQRIVTASNVRLRTAPQMNSEEVGRLPLGTLLAELDASGDAAWFRVQSADGKTGWIFGALTQAFTESEAVSIYRRLIQARLSIEEAAFTDAADLFTFIERVGPQLQGLDEAELHLFRLRALHQSLRGIIGYEPRDTAQQAWIKRHEEKLVYSEPAGQWLVMADLYWQLEEKYRGHPVAEQMAWEGATAGVPGECEGYIPCVFAVLLMTDGRYLELYPEGSHAAEALEHIDYPFEEILKPNAPYEMDPRESKELQASIAKLRVNLERSSDPQKTGILSRLKRIEERYR